MSSRRLDMISDYTRAGFLLQVGFLGCKRLVILDPMEITLTCQRRGWSRQIASIERRLRCANCGSREVRIGPTLGGESRPV